MKSDILVIDDDEGVLEALANLLRLHDYPVRTALSGEDGLSMCEESMPAVVLVEVGLPGIDGIETLRRIKQMNAGCRVVIVPSTILPAMRWRR